MKSKIVISSRSSILHFAFCSLLKHFVFCTGLICTLNSFALNGLFEAIGPLESSSLKHADTSAPDDSTFFV